MSCVLKECKYHVTKLGIGQKVRIRVEYFSNSSHCEKAFLDLTAMKHTVVFSRYFPLHTNDIYSANFFEQSVYTR